MSQEFHVVGVSGGKDSTALACRLRELHPDREFIWAITPTGAELPEMFHHWRKLGDYLGGSLYPITADTGLNGLIKRQNAIPNRRQRWCTRILKIEPYRAFLMQLSEQGTVHSYIGLRAGEEGRVGGAYGDIPGVVMHFPMRDEWGWGLTEVWGYLSGIPGHTNASMADDIPQRTDCFNCFYQRLIEWWRLWKYHPFLWAAAKSQEKATGHTFRSPSRDTWPAALEEMEVRFEAGEIPKERKTKEEKSSEAYRGACRVCSM